MPSICVFIFPFIFILFISRCIFISCKASYHFFFSLFTFYSPEALVFFGFPLDNLSLFCYASPFLLKLLFKVLKNELDFLLLFLICGMAFRVCFILFPNGTSSSLDLADVTTLQHHNWCAWTWPWDIEKILSYSKSIILLTYYFLPGRFLYCLRNGSCLQELII